MVLALRGQLASKPAKPYAANLSAPRVQMTRAAALPSASGSTGGRLVDSLQQQLQSLQLPDGEQGFQAAQQYGGQAATAAAAAWSSLISPLAVFGDAWLLNVLFLGSMGLLVYSLLVLAPRQ